MNHGSYLSARQFLLLLCDFKRERGRVKRDIRTHAIVIADMKR